MKWVKKFSFSNRANKNKKFKKLWEILKIFIFSVPHQTIQYKSIEERNDYYNKILPEFFKTEKEKEILMYLLDARFYTAFDNRYKDTKHSMILKLPANWENSDIFQFVLENSHARITPYLFSSDWQKVLERLKELDI